jgi:hypothetical protein
VFVEIGAFGIVTFAAAVVVSLCNGNLLKNKLFVCFRILNVARRIGVKQKDHLRERGFLFSFFLFFFKELFLGIYHGDHYSKLEIDLSL